jgi:hypothetical protein
VSYAVYRGTTSGTESATPVAAGLTATSYTSSGLANGTKYYYVVRAVNATGASAPSNEASATPTAPKPTFSLSLAPTSAAVRRGSAGSAAARVTETGGTQRVTFGAAHAPAGVKVSFSPSSVTATGSSTMKVTVGSTAKTGTYRITATASGASGTKSLPFTLTIR